MWTYSPGNLLMCNSFLRYQKARFIINFIFDELIYFNLYKFLWFLPSSPVMVQSRSPEINRFFNMLNIFNIIKNQSIDSPSQTHTCGIHRPDSGHRNIVELHSRDLQCSPSSEPSAQSELRSLKSNGFILFKLPCRLIFFFYFHPPLPSWGNTLRTIGACKVIGLAFNFRSIYMTVFFIGCVAVRTIGILIYWSIYSISIKH